MESYMLWEVWSCWITVSAPTISSVIPLQFGLICIVLSAVELAEVKNGDVFVGLLKSSGLHEGLGNPLTLFVPPNQALLVLVIINYFLL